MKRDLKIECFKIEYVPLTLFMYATFMKLLDQINISDND